MIIQINTGHNIQGNETLIAKFRSTIKSALSRISDHITSVEVHLKDEDGNREEGTTTTPFDIVVLNDLDRFH